MNEHNSIASLVNAINAILYQAGGTRTDAALNWVDKNAFTTAAGNRDHVIYIVIVMTDGSLQTHTKRLLQQHSYMDTKSKHLLSV